VLETQSRAVCFKAQINLIF